jgi:hypothetical protein
MVAAQIPPAAATWLRPGEMKMWANVHSSGDALRKPPPCARVHTCDAAAAGGGGACDASAAAPFYAQPSPSAAQLPEARLRGLRVFFLEGHVGPMNDMLATLHDGLGMNTSGPEGMVFMRASPDNRPRTGESHRGSLSPLAPCAILLYTRPFCACPRELPVLLPYIIADRSAPHTSP